MVPADASVQRVLLQPSTAWGDGGHPTTRMIIQWLNSSDLQGAAVLDYGCALLLVGEAIIWDCWKDVLNRHMRKFDEGTVLQVWYRDPGAFNCNSANLLCLRASRVSQS